MINGEKIGVAIVTHNRQANLEKLYLSLPFDYIDSFIIINDGNHISSTIIRPKHIHNNEKNIGVGKSKNKAIEYLKIHKVDHYFIIEDDIIIIDKSIFHAYIEASKLTGIQHFNSALHTKENLKDNKPNPLISLKYNNKISISLYFSCCGTFSYYSKICINKVGLMDEIFFNAVEHIDHTLRCIHHKMHPNFWYFSDISNSHKYIRNIYQSSEYISVINNNINAKKNLQVAHVFFRKKYQINSIKEIKMSNIFSTISDLQRIYNERSFDNKNNLLMSNLLPVIKKIPSLTFHATKHNTNRLFIKIYFKFKLYLKRLKNIFYSL